MRIEDIDWNNIVETQKRLNKRITNLETDSEHIAGLNHKNENQSKEMFEKFRAELEYAKKNLDDLKIQMKNNIIEMELLITKIKQSAKKEDLNNISSRIDEFNPEQLITKNELSRRI